MAKQKTNGKSKGGMADPTGLRPTSDDDSKTIQVVIETHKGSRNK